MKFTSRIRMIPAAVAVAGAALTGALALPAAASAAPAGDVTALSSGRAGPYGPEECEQMRYTFMHYGYHVSSCYEWWPTGTGPTPGGGWFLDYWT
jgi:hypothetical protein